jgi:hypothetical protein
MVLSQDASNEMKIDDIKAMREEKLVPPKFGPRGSPVALPSLRSLVPWKN